MAYLSDEVGCFLGGIVLDVRGDEATTKFFHTDVLHVEANVVTWASFFESFVVHLDGFDFSRQGRWCKVDDHVGLEKTGLNSTDGYCTDTTDFVDILQG